MQVESNSFLRSLGPGRASLGNRRRLSRLAWLAVCGCLFPAWLALGSEQELRFSDQLRMVDCRPASSIPCFRLKANIVDRQGKARSVELPPGGQLAQSLTVQVNGQEQQPFYAAATSGDGNQVQSRIALLLIDVSGSMAAEVSEGRSREGQSRFDAAREAAAEFLKDFEDGTDHAAIVSFESHRVTETIRAARFTTNRVEALQQIHDLPRPRRDNNTALYTAVDVGLDVIQQTAATLGGSSAEVLMLVLTDGRNDVRLGDDPGLLEDRRDLDRLARRVAASGTQVVAIGFGQEGSIDTTALDLLSTKHHLVQTPKELRRVFSMERALLKNRIQATFYSPWPDRASLAGMTLRVQVELRSPDGTEIQSNETIWSPPQLAVPPFEGECAKEERLAALEFQRRAASPPSSSPWVAILRPILVFVGIGSVILILWFWVPRLVWPIQHSGDLAAMHSRSRWLATSPRSSAQPPGRSHRPPPGFGTQGGGRPNPERAPGEQTIAQTKIEFSTTRTRLGPRRSRKNEG